MSACPSCGWKLGVNPSWCSECAKVEPTWVETDDIGNPLTDKEIRALGYEPTLWGWMPADLDRRPAPSPDLCRGCGKYLATMSGRLCPACVYFGKGDPHGLNDRPDKEVLKFREPYPNSAPKPTEVCKDCRGYMATGPDRLCWGCAWEASRTTLSFSEWKVAQQEAARRLWRLRARGRPA
jgi:hypothetical protein